ncbi:hypothetical protein HNQ59_001216 [Chitinivorax tropicus]|uniref:SnoaL-like domain-containing protein n=1 Tax=Chitinivorax tropicus TaxID=714531 RepID=A0A840MRT4_9PROT|nr:nuclear transport factor 2 family protein [Chitinivorax tropicus]MBB5017931.1 hypothetical protein [Chitinivorax tropicus]
MSPIQFLDQFLSMAFNGERDAALALVHPDAQIIPSRPAPSDTIPLYGKLTGPTGMRQLFTLLGALLKPEQFVITTRFTDGRHVAFSGYLKHISVQTDKAFESDWALIARIDEGLLTYYHFYEDTAALEAALMNDTH